MALDKTNIPIPFAGGIDTKTDDKQVMPTKLLELENGIFSKSKSIQKRNGYDLLLKNIINSSSAISAASGISTFKNELNLFTGSKLYSYIEASQAWIERGSVVSVSTSDRSIIRNIYQQTDVDYAYNQGISCYAWKDSSAGARFTVIDETTGSIIQENQLLSATGQKPRVVGVGNYIFVLYIDGSAIKFRYIAIATPASISSAVDLTTTVDAVDKIYDVQKLGERAYIAYNTNVVGGSVAAFYLTANRAVSSEVSYLATQAVGGISICSDSDENVWISWYDGADIKTAIWDSNLSVDGLGHPTVLYPAATVETVANVRNIASVAISSTQIKLFYEISNSPQNFIRQNTLTVLGVAGTASVFKRGIGLASKFFTYNDLNYITTTSSSTLQSTYYVYSIDGDIITKINQDVGGGYTSSSILPTVVEFSSGKFIVPVLEKGILQTENSVVFTSLGVTGTTLDFVSLNNFITAELADSMHINGGLLQSYDGASIVESGFLQFPEGVTASEVNIGAGNLANGQYQHVVVYAWIDNSGKIHRSAQSIPVTTTVAGGPSNIQLTIPTLRITKKQNVFIEVYRTEVNQTLFYKVTSNTSLTLNSTSVDTITFTDSVTDAALISNELLYTTGGVLDNIAPPPSTMLTVWKNRIVVKSSDEPNVIWYSKIRNEGFPVEFSDALVITVDPRGGDITGLGVLDDKLIIFKETSIHLLSGDGPNNLGQQSDFGLPQLITGDAGCIDSNSIIQTPVGLMFKSKKGIYLLNRGLGVGYIGAEVEGFNEFRVTAARLITDTNQVRFTTETDKCLVYDYLFDQWSTFTNHEAVGATLYNDQFTFVKANGDVFSENASVSTDGGNAVKLKLVTSWMNVAEISGFQRLYKFLILGSYKSKHRLRVKIGYDFNNTFTQEVTFDPYSVIDPVAYGDSSPYGDEAVYGGNAPLYQWRIFPERQKCQSFRISIEDILDDVLGESFSISALRLEVGLKKNSNKLSTARSYGSQ